MGTRFYIWNPIYSFTQSEIGGTSENIKIDCINYIYTNTLHDFSLNCRTNYEKWLVKWR